MWILFLACTPQSSLQPTDSDTDVVPIVQAEPLELALSAHPRLLLDGADRELVRARVTMGVANPQATALLASYYEHVVQTCDGGQNAPDSHDPGDWLATAAAARNCAFLAWLNDDAVRGEHANALLISLPDDVDGLELDRDVHLYTSLALAAEAWDFLAATPQATPEAEASLTAFAESTFRVFVQEGTLFLLLQQNNHNLKAAGALGLAGLALDAAPDRLLWVSWAQTEIDALSTTLYANGGYGEGPYYQSYADFQVLPYLLAYHRLVGATRSVEATCATRPVGTCTPGPQDVVDLWDDSRTRAGWAWNRRIRRPDGMRPPIDDAQPVGYPSSLMAIEDPAYGWDFLTQQPPNVANAGDATVEVLATWDGSGTEPTEDPCYRNPSAGTGIAANGRGPDAAWVLLLGESSGPAAPGGHEHADAGTFQFYARRHALSLDPAYAGWTDHAATSGYSSHSGVLIDGVGLTDGVNSPLTVAWPESDVCRPKVAIDHHGVGWERGVWLVGEDLVVADSLGAAAGHDVEWRVQLASQNGRGTLERKPYGGLVRWLDVTLVVVFAAEGATLSVESGTDSPGYGQLTTHDVLVGRVAATGDVTSKWVLAVREAGVEPEVAVEGGIVIDGVAY